MKKQHNVLIYQKILYAFFIILFYIVGRCVPLYGVDTTTIDYSSLEPEQILLHSIGGDAMQLSLFALGISPYITGSMAVTLINACRSSEARAKTSQKKLQRLILLITVIAAAVMSYFKVNQLPFIQDPHLLEIKSIAFIELFTGAILIVRLISRNQKYGIGGQGIFIFINVVDQLVMASLQVERSSLHIFAGACLGVVLIMIILENIEIRLPIQRISIHNVHADKNYLAIKLNPVGVMPIMFASAVYSFPRVIMAFIIQIFGSRVGYLSVILDMTTLDTMYGIALYVGIIYLLTLGYAFITVNPDNISEQLLKGGDSLEDIRAGKKTKRYLSRKLVFASIIGASIMSAFVVLPMLGLTPNTNYQAILSVIPTIMIITGLWCGIYREIGAVKAFDSYKEIL